MIEVNFAQKKKPLKLPEVMGLDFSRINIGMVIIAYIVYLVPDWFVYPVFKEEAVKAQEEVIKLQKKDRTLKKELRKFGDIEKQIDAFKSQEKKLQKKLIVVKEIIKLKKNPMKIMHYLTKSIPEDAWVESFVIEDDKLTVMGKSKSYKSIGIFLENLKSSIFFDKTLRLAESRTDEGAGRYRTEFFEITGNIVRYD